MSDPVRRVRETVGVHAPDPFPDPKQPEAPPPAGPDVVPHPPVSDPTPVKPPAPVRDPGVARPPAVAVMRARHAREARTLH